MISRQSIANKINEYLVHAILLEDLVDWAENSLIDEEFEAGYFEVIRNVLSKIGLADVKEFGLTWEDCEDLLRQVGYRVNVHIVQNV